MDSSPQPEPLLTPAEVATLFRVDPKTVTRWATAGKLDAIRTLGGHRRYRESEVRGLLAGIPRQRDAEAATNLQDALVPDASVQLEGDAPTQLGPEATSLEQR